MGGDLDRGAPPAFHQPLGRTIVPRGIRECPFGHLALPVRAREPQRRADGDPGRARTCDLALRRRSLYPAELRGRRPQWVHWPTRPTLKLSEYEIGLAVASAGGSMTR